MKANESPKLPEIFSNWAQLNLDTLLENSIQYGCKKIGCKGGSAYLFNGATLDLDLIVHSYENKTPPHYEMNKQIVAQSHNKQQMICCPDGGFDCNSVNSKILHSDQLRSVVAIPVYAYPKEAVAVFCFDFLDDSHPGSKDANLQGLTLDEKLAVEELRAELTIPDIGKFLYLAQVNQVQNNIQFAGLAPSNLRKEVSRYISKMQEAFDKSDYQRPDSIYVQIVDQAQESIRTIQGVGMPLTFEFSLAHPLSGRDIQADIVRSRQLETIVGLDPRFDKAVYDKFEHWKYVRLFMPLFPFPISRFNIGKNKRIDTVLKDILIWQPEIVIKGSNNEVICRNQVTGWETGEDPPQPLVFGTLEIGYKRKNWKKLEFEPWTRELIEWCAARALEFCLNLYSTTLHGTLENIGSILTSVTHDHHLRFSCTLPYRRSRELRGYPTDQKWPAAIPEDRSSHSSDSLDHLTEKMIFPSFREKSISVEHIVPYGASNSLFPSGQKEYLKEIYASNARLANSAVETAFQLYDLSMNPYRLVDPAVTSDAVGTLNKQRIIDSVCQEALNLSGAIASKFYSLENQYDLNQQVDPLKDWREYETPAQMEKGKEFLIKKSQIAQEVATNKRSIYETVGNEHPTFTHYCVFPLELADGALGVLSLLFDDFVKELSDEKKRALESQIPFWIYRISMHRLVMRHRFSEMLMKLRIAIAEARKESEKIQSNTPCVTSFLGMTLERVLKEMDWLMPLAGGITHYNKSSTGPNILQRFWGCLESDQKGEIAVIQIENHSFLNTELSGPCNEVHKKNDVLVYYDRSEQPGLKKIFKELNGEAEKLKQEGEEKLGESLKQYAKILNDETGESTVLAFPTLARGAGEDIYQSAVTLVFARQHYFDDLQKMLIMELGEQIAENLRQVRNSDQERLEKKHKKQLEKRRRQFEKAKHVDDIIAAFFQGLGGGETDINSTKQDQKEDWGVADDAVIWNLSSDNTELIARSAKGKGLDALENKFGIIKVKDHPLLSNEKIFWPKKSDKDSASLDGPFRLWTFRIREPDYGKTAKEINQAYAQGTSRKWLTSFPVVDTLNHIFGVVDLLRDEPLTPEEVTVMERMFFRLSRQLCSAVESCHLRHARRITNSIYSKVGQLDRLIRTQEVYEGLVQQMKEEFRSTHCDLFLERDGRMMLHTTTRLDNPFSDEKRFEFQVEVCDIWEEILGYCFKEGRALIRHAASFKPDLGHLSVDLQNLIADDFQYERMALPLYMMTKNHKNVIGIIHVRGPIIAQNKEHKGQPNKKSQYFASEDLRLAYHLSLSIQRIIQMVRLVEQQGLLVTQLGHSMGQPLQAIYNSIEKSLNTVLRGEEINAKDIIELVDIGFDIVREEREQLGFLTAINRPDINFSYKNVDLKKLVQEWCDFMSRITTQKDKRIYYGDVNFIKKIPIERHWMRRAIINLLENAQKYSWKGREIAVKASENQKGEVNIEVTNWGIGIPPDHIERIFEPFFRSKTPDSKGDRFGTGIGLAIVKHAIEEVHLGNVSVKSAPWRTLPKKSDNSSEGVVDAEFQTTFTIQLKREKLNLLFDQHSEKEISHDEQV